MFKMIEDAADKLGIGDLMLVIVSAAVIIVIILLAVVVITRSRGYENKEKTFMHREDDKEIPEERNKKAKDNHAHTGTR